MKKWSRVARRWTAVLEVLAGVPRLPPALSQEMSAAPPQPAPSPALLLLLLLLLLRRRTHCPAGWICIHNLFLFLRS